MTPATPTEIHPFDRFMVVDYVDELRDLDATYAAASAVDVEPFAQWIRAHADRPLIAAGAGGSLAVAQLAAHLHTRATGQLATSGEPMDLYLMEQTATNTSVLLVTASGGHSDSLASCKLLPSLPVDSAVFCGKIGSAGETLLKGTSVDVFGYELLPDAHGWVAVNVLLAQSVVLARAYAAAFPEALGEVPATLAALLPGGGSVEEALDLVVADLAEVLARPLLVFLHGPDTRTAAIDLDSKFAESGLGELAMSEYRNFAHGRYQMMLPRQGDAGVLSLFTVREEPLAQASLDAIPAHIPHAGILVPGTSPAAEQVGCLVLLLLVVGAIGRVREIEIGWGSRNTFGDTLYDLDLASFLTPFTAHSS